MTPNQRQLVESLRARFGAGMVETDPQALAPWLTDWRGRFHGAVTAMLSPASLEEVQAAVALAGEAGVPLVPQGGNTSMVGGATPPPDGSAVILSLRRMKRIRTLSAEKSLAVAEAGVILADLQDAARGAGRRFPLDLGSRGSATIGGLVSTNAGGTQVLRFGTMRGLVAGVEAVLPDGSVHQGLSALKKDNRGYDLDQLLIGAEGTLAIVTAATLRLVPAVVSRAVAWVGLGSPGQALRLLRHAERQTQAIESFEIIPAEALESVLAHIAATRSPVAAGHRWHVLVEAVSTDPCERAPDDLLTELLRQALEAGLADDAVVSASEAQAEAFWRIRHGISESERARGPAVQHDISVPVDAIPDFMVDAGAAIEARFAGTRAVAYGHLGDGNVHFHVRAPAGADRAGWQAGEAPAITRAVHDLVVEAGGSISAEHGIGQMKRDELERLGPASRIAAMRAIKQALDPAGILNPGKLVTLAPRSDRP